MKTTIAQLCLGASIIVAVALAIQLVRMICRISKAIPEETVIFGWSPVVFVRWVFIAASPLALYGLGVALDRDSLSSLLGRVGIYLGASYVVVLVVGSIYVHRLVSALNRKG